MGPRKFNIEAYPGEEGKACAGAYINPFVGAANTMVQFGNGIGGMAETADLNDMIDLLEADLVEIESGNFESIISVLAAQTHTLNCVANSLFRTCFNADGRQMLNVVKLALKAQNQCRISVEAIARVKYLEAGRTALTAQSENQKSPIKLLEAASRPQLVAAK